MWYPFIVPIKTKAGQGQCQPARAAAAPGGKNPRITPAERVHRWKVLLPGPWSHLSFVRRPNPPQELHSLNYSLSRDWNQQRALHGEPRPWLHTPNCLRRSRACPHWAPDPRDLCSGSRVGPQHRYFWKHHEAVSLKSTGTGKKRRVMDSRRNKPAVCIERRGIHLRGH